tara:strand:- start:132 stop:1175 length:1044 start_codon:yes stop_codon:yes gene_type:complete
VNTTDLETAAESLLYDASPEADETEVTQDDAPEVGEAEIVEEFTEDGEEDEDVSDDDDADEADESDDEDDTAEESEGQADFKKMMQAMNSHHASIKSDGSLAFNVKVDGEAVEVSAEDLTRSYSGQAYIQKGMQETAEGRKQFQADIAAFQADQQRFADAVHKLQSDGLKAQPQKPDAKMLETDPIGYMRAQARYDSDVADYTAQQTQLQETSQRASAYQDQQSQQHLQMQAQRLAELIPDFADPEKATALKSKLVEVGQSAYGYSAEELAGLTDARAVSVLNDAMRWRELQSGTAKAKTTPKPQRSVKPTGRRSQPKSVVRDKQLAQARKSGNPDDFMALMFEPKN